MEGPLAELASAATEVSEGRFDAAKKIFDLTKRQACPSSIQTVAEAFGMMAVRVEAREFRLQRALDEIRRKNSALEDASRARAEFATMASFIVIVLSLYAIALSFMQNVVKLDINLRRASVESISFGFLMLQIVLAVAFVMKHKPPPADYGWTFRNWRRSLSESLIVTGVVFLVLVVIKVLLVSFVPALHGAPVFNWTNWGGWAMVTSYLFVAPAQELIGRGFLQNSIERFLTGRRRTLLAVVLTSVQFGVVHLHFSFTTGAVAMVSGLLFGAMFARHRTIVGVSVSHFILGSLAFGPLQLLSM